MILSKNIIVYIYVSIPAGFFLASKLLLDNGVMSLYGEVETNDVHGGR